MTTPLDDDLDLAIQADAEARRQHGRGVATDVARWAPNRALLAAQPADGGCRSCEMRDMPPRPGDFMLDEHVPLKEYLDAHAGYAEPTRPSTGRGPCSKSWPSERETTTAPMRWPA
jgi:hypothetical protein